jgi:PAS domain S-box-containing protein
VDKTAAIADLQSTALGTLGQTCVAGMVLNLTAALVTFWLWRRDASERYLGFWSAAYLCGALRWLMSWPAIGTGIAAAQAAAGLFAAGALCLHLLGALSLVPQRRIALGAAAMVLTAALGVLLAAGVWLARLSTIFNVIALLAWGAGACMFWLAHQRQPLAAYRLAAFAMLFNLAVFGTGMAVAGRAFATSIVMPLTVLPTMLAFFMIAHQRALAKARDSEETLTTLFDTVPVPIVISVPPQGKLERINQQALKTFGMSFDSSVGKSSLQNGVVADTDVRAWIYAELAAGRDVRNREMTYRTTEGSPLPVSVNASRVDLRDGTRYVFTLFDLSDFRRVENALQKLNTSLEQQVTERTRDLEAFSYSVSHDLRAPLRAIDGYSKLLDEEAGDRLSGPARDYLARIRANCRRMNDLIEAMLSLSQHGTATLEPTLVDISALAGQLIDDMRHAEPQRRIEVVIEPWMRATADAAAVRIVLDNLLRNAWKYTSKVAQAKIDIGCDTAGGERVYWVRDNGAGFEMAQAGDLFKPFRRLHAASDFEGSGVGLATVARVIRNLGGHIEGESKPGAGAVFRFTLAPAGLQAGRAASA